MRFRTFFGQTPWQMQHGARPTSCNGVVGVPDRSRDHEQPSFAACEGLGQDTERDGQKMFLVCRRQVRVTSYVSSFVCVGSGDVVRTH